MSDELDGDGIGGAVLEVLTGNAFRLLVSHTRKDNKGDYGKTEKIKTDIVLGFFVATSRLISINWLVSIGYTKVAKANNFDVRSN